MRNLYRFFIHNSRLSAGDVRELSVDVSHHLTRVLRIQKGATLQLFDGSGREFQAQVTSVCTRVEVVCMSETPNTDIRESKLPIVLAAAVGKHDKLDTIVQKATELGVFAIQPLITHRTENRPATLGSADTEGVLKKLAHWHQIAVSACQQSGRCVIPMVLPPLPLRTYLTRALRTSRPSDAALNALQAIEYPFEQSKNGVTGRILQNLTLDRPVLNFVLDAASAPSGGGADKKQPTSFVNVRAATLHHRVALDSAQPPVVQLLVGPEGGFSADEVRISPFSSCVSLVADVKCSFDRFKNVSRKAALYHCLLVRVC
jgi:RsmE family RNA methyltransferase